MILIDLNQVLISNYMAQTRGQQEPNIDMFRHMVLNSIRGYNGVVIIITVANTTLTRIPRLIVKTQCIPINTYIG